MSLSPGIVAALESAGLDPAYVEHLVRSTVAEVMGFDVTHHSLHIFGTCKACRAQHEKTTPTNTPARNA